MLGLFPNVDARDRRSTLMRASDARVGAGPGPGVRLGVRLRPSIMSSSSCCSCSSTSASIGCIDELRSGVPRSMDPPRDGERALTVTVERDREMAKGEVFGRPSGCESVALSLGTKRRWRVAAKIRAHPVIFLHPRLTAQLTRRAHHQGRPCSTAARAQSPLLLLPLLLPRTPSARWSRRRSSW